MGDLNFRIDDLSEERIFQLIETKNWSNLVRHDQLKKAIHEKTAFEEFREGRILFQPTYKFLPASSEYTRG